MSKLLKLGGLAVASVLALTACGGNGGDVSEVEANTTAESPAGGDPTPMDSMGVMEAGEFETYSSGGGHIVFDLPADSDSEELVELEEYREDVNADPVTYLIADVDNRNGSESINMYQVKAFDEDGNSYEFSDVSAYVSEIGPTYTGDYEYVLPDGEVLDDELGFELSERNTDLHNEYLDGASPAERKTMILVHEGDDLPDEFTRVAVWPNGAGEEVEALPTDF